MKMATHYSQKIELYLTITITTTRKKYGGVPINPSNHVKSVRNPCCTNESQSVYSTIHSTISGSIHMCIYIYAHMYVIQIQHSIRVIHLHILHMSHVLNVLHPGSSWHQIRKCLRHTLTRGPLLNMNTRV